MNISSNINAIKNFISEIPKTNLGNLEGRIVTLIKDNALLFGFGCITVLAIGTFCYFRSKPEENKSTPPDQKAEIKEGTIIGSKINTLVIKNYRNRDLRYYNQDEELDSFCKKFGIRNWYHEHEVEEGTDNLWYKVIQDKRSFPKDTLHSKGTIMHDSGPLEASTVNYTKHKMNLYKSNGYSRSPDCVYLDKFLVYKELSALWIQVMPFKDRPDLLCIQMYNTPIKLIVLEKVGKNYVISWEADAKDFGVPVKDQPHNFEFSIEKIDSASFRKNICPLLLFANRDENSTFANIPREIINLIGMHGITYKAFVNEKLAVMSS